MMDDQYDPVTGEVVEEDQPSVPTTLTIAAARTLIRERHNAGLDEDDPALMLVTLHGGFVGDYERMLSRHNEALTTIIGTAISGLTEKALAAHLENQVRLADRIEQEFKGQLRRAKIVSVINVIAALICIPVLTLLILK